MIGGAAARRAGMAVCRTILLGLAGCGPDTPARTLVGDAALADTVQGENWLAFGRTTHEQRFSPLTQIDDSNVAGLAVDWYLDLPGDRGLGSTPLVVDGVMYFIGSMNVVRAVDAALLAHELIKVRLHEPEDKKAAARHLAESTGAALCGLIGHTVILYRPHPEKPRLAIRE